MAFKFIVSGEPQYKHDCDACAFLGTYLDTLGGVKGPQHADSYDLYYCHGENTRLPTVIARYSSRGPDYLSGLVEGQTFDRALSVAVVRAVRYLQTKLSDIAKLAGGT